MLLFGHPILRMGVDDSYCTVDHDRSPSLDNSPIVTTVPEKTLLPHRTTPPFYCMLASFSDHGAFHPRHRLTRPNNDSFPSDPPALGWNKQATIYESEPVRIYQTFNQLNPLTPAPISYLLTSPGKLNQVSATSCDQLKLRKATPPRKPEPLHFLHRIFLSLYSCQTVPKSILQASETRSSLSYL